MRRALIQVPDLFFNTRIGATAEKLGVEVESIGSVPAHETVDRCGALLPDLVILDLHATGEPLALAQALKADERTRGIPIVAFYSHVDQALRHRALEAGVDRVLPRSAFTAELPGILGGNPSSSRPPR